MSPEPTRPAPEVLVMGRLGVDGGSLPVGAALPEVARFAESLGGGAATVAVAARHGRPGALISRTGADPVGKYPREAVRDFEVASDQVTAVSGWPTPVTFRDAVPPDDFPICFYRPPKAPDLEIYPEELDQVAARDAGVFGATGTGAAEPSLSARTRAPTERSRQSITVFDLDHRSGFRRSREAAREQCRRVPPFGNVEVGNSDEIDTAVDTRDPLGAAAGLHQAEVEPAVVKQGSAGMLASGAKPHWRRGASAAESG